MASKAEIACIYAALILSDDDVAITDEKIQTILKAANVNVEPYWPGLFAKALEGVNVKDLIISNIASGVGGCGASTSGTAGDAISSTDASAANEEKKVEEKKKEESEESDDDMGFGLFD